jgi:hypothetical protein
MEASSAVDTWFGSRLFVAEDYPSSVPSHAVAYTAGFFDGEGCVNIARYLQRGRPYHTLAIIFTNTDFDVLEWLHQRWGGYLTRPVVRANSRWRPYRSLHLSAGPAGPLLRAMLPYLIVKKSEVEIALQFIEAKSDNRRGRKRDPAALAKRADLAARLPRPRSRFNDINRSFHDVENTADQKPRTFEGVIRIGTE